MKAINGKKGSSSKIRTRDIKIKSNSKERRKSQHKISISDMMKKEFKKVNIQLINPESLDNYHEEKFVKEKSDITKNMEKIKDEYSKKDI